METQRLALRATQYVKLSPLWSTWASENCFRPLNSNAAMKTLQKRQMLVLIGQGPLVVVWIYDSCRSGAKVEVVWHCYWGLKTAWRGALGGFGVQQHGTLTPKTTVKFDPQLRQGRGADIVLERGLNRKHCVQIFTTTLSCCLCLFIV